MAKTGQPGLTDSGVSHGAGNWIGKFSGMNTEEVFDLVTSMFLKEFDDQQIANSLSRQYRVDLTAHIVRQIRFDAATYAETVGTPNARKRWAFRYQNLTPNNLIKEYMFLTGSSSFLEAKMELADELYWLQRQHTKQQLWQACNYALGRENVPLDLVDELIEFRETVLRIKRLIRTYADSTGEGANPMRVLHEAARQISDAYQNTCNRNKAHTAEHACGLFGLEPGKIEPVDIDFFREFHRSAQLPERNERGSMTLLLQGDDSVQGRGLLDDAVEGNLDKMSQDDIQQVANEMRSKRVLRQDSLLSLRKHISARARKKQPGYSLLRSVVKLVDSHLALTSVRRLFTPGERLKMLILRVPRDELQHALNTLNTLASNEEVTWYASSLIRRCSYPRTARLLARKYCMKRFGTPFKIAEE